MGFRRGRQAGDVIAIFVHAGAGFHSHQNEKLHLKICEDAAKAAMAFLRNGGTAVDAVEVAIKVLEDKEITNAGYGSNLAVDGTVEGDATIVDHFGRSGAVGAIGQVRNPIHVARLVLEHSNQPLSLRRVPPNLLVGQGATDFAFECRVPVLPPSDLVSPDAKWRYQRWQRDLLRAQQQAEESDLKQHKLSQPSDSGAGEEDEAHSDAIRFPAIQNRLLAGLANEAQPCSPQLLASEPSDDGSAESRPRKKLQKKKSSAPSSSTSTSRRSSLAPRNQQIGDTTQSPSRTNSRSPKYKDNDGQASLYLEDCSSDDEGARLAEADVYEERSNPTSPTCGGHFEQNTVTLSSHEESPSIASPVSSPVAVQGDLLGPQSDSEDTITDTVGAIAIDCFGHMAAGSSSGGIGMKHKGRTGPAALVGIGTTVLPVDPDDKSKTCVATVMSGTGEHMATTMASHTCAQRLYFNSKRGKHGLNTATDEEGAIQSFVLQDFMNHPSVKHSTSPGAIGVMAVKKTTEGVWLHFAHNTDSFALASMRLEDNEPHCVMSRTSGNAKVTTGARSFRHQKPIKQTRSEAFAPVAALDGESSQQRSSIEEPRAKRHKQEDILKVEVEIEGKVDEPRAEESSEQWQRRARLKRYLKQ